MRLKKLTDNIYYDPHQPEVDRPMLAYLKGSRMSLAIDAGYSDNHVNDFYEHLNQSGLKKPDFTAITHWHYDHTFGMHQIQGASIACCRTNEFLRKEQQKAVDLQYIDKLKMADPCFKREYHNKQSLNIVLSDIEFREEIILNLGGLTAKIFQTVSPHSEDAVCLYVPEEKVLFLGDSTSEDFFNGGFMDHRKLKKLIMMIEDTNCEFCVLSHTEPLKKGELLEYLYGILQS